MSFFRLNSFVSGNQFIGIELFSANAEDSISIVEVRKRKNELVIKKKEKKSVFQNVIQKSNRNIPVILTLNNNQVIQKEIEYLDVSDLKLLYKAFPNIKIDEFFYEIWRLETKSVVAICRKNYIQKLIYKDFNSICISSISLGICSICNITAFIDCKTIKTNNLTINIEHKTLLTPNENDDVITYDVNGIKLQSTYLLAFCGILHKINPNLKVSGNINDINNLLYDTYYQNSFFRKGLKVMVITLLTLLLLNFFIFNYYYKKTIQSSLSVMTSKEKIDKVRQVSQRLIAKENKIKAVSNLAGLQSSFLISDLINQMPSSILLNELIYHPIAKKIKEDQLIIINGDVILISGKTLNTKELTRWFEVIENKDWVKSTSIIHFGKNENNESVFTLKINLKPNEIKQ